MRAVVASAAGRGELHTDEDEKQSGGAKSTRTGRDADF